MKQRMRIVDAKNKHLPELAVYIDGKLIGYASWVGCVGGCPEVFDMVNKAEFKRIERRLKLMNKEATV